MNNPKLDPPLGICLPDLILGGYYHLIHVGSVNPHLDEPSDREVMVSFQAKASIHYYSELLAPPLVKRVSIQYAAKWEVGSVWTAAGTLVASGAVVLPNEHIFRLSELSMRLVMLEDLLPDKISISLTGDYKPRTWVAEWQENGVHILVPCFELVRIFYYHAGPRFLNFFLARMPIAALGRVVEGPTLDNAYQAHICASVCTLTRQEARVLTELLLNYKYRRAIEHTHEVLALQGLESSQEGYFKMTYPFTREIRGRGHGMMFTVAGRKYFWVGTLQLLDNPFSFQKLLFHPLRAYQAPKSASESSFAYTDSLASVHLGTSPHVKSNDLRHEPKSVPHTPGDIWGRDSITRGFPWARSVPPQGAPQYLSENVQLPWESDTIKSNPFEEENLRIVVSWHQEFIQCFQSRGYSLRSLTFNNSQGLFGADISLCYYGGIPPIRGAVYQHLVQTATIIEGTYGDSVFYLLYAVKGKESAFICCRGLVALNTSALEFILGLLAAKQGELAAVADELQRARTRRRADTKDVFLAHLLKNMTPEQAVNQCIRILSWPKIQFPKKRVSSSI